MVPGQGRSDPPPVQQPQVYIYQQPAPALSPTGPPGGSIGSHNLLPGEQYINHIAVPNLCCLCIPWAEHKLTLTNKRVLAQYDERWVPGPTNIATSKLSDVTAAFVARGKAPFWSTLLLACVVFSCLINYENQNSGNNKFVSYVFGVVIVIVYFCACRPPAFKFAVNATQNEALFTASGDPMTVCCNRMSNNVQLMNDFAAQKEHSV